MVAKITRPPIVMFPQAAERPADTITATVRSIALNITRAAYRVHHQQRQKRWGRLQAFDDPPAAQSEMNGTLYEHRTVFSPCRYH